MVGATVIALRGNAAIDCMCTRGPEYRGCGDVQGQAFYITESTCVCASRKSLIQSLVRAIAHARAHVGGLSLDVTRAITRCHSLMLTLFTRILFSSAQCQTFLTLHSLLHYHYGRNRTVYCRSAQIHPAHSLPVALARSGNTAWARPQELRNAAC